jgi:UDP-glucose 4-epimerase
MSVLVTGGAGYIGSHMVLALLNANEDVVVLDNLATGVRDLVAKEALFIEGDAGNSKTLSGIFEDHDIDGVIHFAGSVVVPDSVADPLAYYGNNTVTSQRLAQACVKHGIENFVFSSTAAVYGSTGELPVSEDAGTNPINPYGRSKLMTEWMLRDTAAAHSFRYAALRYFNVAGADIAGRSGQSTPKATHLIKRACEVALGKYPYLEIFGEDFPTPDGTGVRDYIDVNDLVDAHLLCLRALRAGFPGGVFNCGYGQGTSVAQVIKVVEDITGKSLPVKRSGRRPGDPAMVIANPSKIKQSLHWKPQHENLRATVSRALAWEKSIYQPLKKSQSV